jgi:hypothetical protein
MAKDALADDYFGEAPRYVCGDWLGMGSSSRRGTTGTAQGRARKLASHTGFRGAGSRPPSGFACISSSYSRVAEYLTRPCHLTALAAKNCPLSTFLSQKASIKSHTCRNKEPATLPYFPPLHDALAGKRRWEAIPRDLGIIPIRCREFLNASRWYFVGPPPAFGGRRPHAGRRPARRAGRRPKHLSSFRRFLIANGISRPPYPMPISVGA